MTDHEFISFQLDKRVRLNFAQLRIVADFALRTFKSSATGHYALVIQGVIGTGKTTLLKAMRDFCHPERTRCVDDDGVAIGGPKLGWQSLVIVNYPIEDLAPYIEVTTIVMVP